MRLKRVKTVGKPSSGRPKADHCLIFAELAGQLGFYLQYFYTNNNFRTLINVRSMGHGCLIDGPLIKIWLAT